MPTSSYTFKVTISGADAIKDAKAIRNAIQAEFGTVSMVDIGNIPEAQKALEELKKTAGGVGRALTAGFRAQVDKLMGQITELQTGVSQVVRAGAGPVEKALDELGMMGLDALDLVDAGSTQATQKMARLTSQIRATSEQLQQIEKTMAQLGTYPLVPAGAAGQVRSINELFREMTGYRWTEVRRLFRDMEKDLKPATEELKELKAAAQAEAVPAMGRLKAEMEELAETQRQLLERRAQLGMWSQEYAQLTAEVEKYSQAILLGEKEMEKLRTIVMTGGMGEVHTALRMEQQKYVAALQDSSVWWKELTAGAGEHKDVIEAVARVDREAAERLARMIALWEQGRKLQTSISRGIGTMDRLTDKIELPRGTEGSLATLVIAERSLGESAKLAGTHLLTQAKALNSLVTALEKARGAAEGLDRVQRAAIQRVEMAAQKQMVQATKVSLGLTPQEAGAAVVPILAQLNVQVEAIKKQTLAQIDEIEQEGQKRRPFSWLLRAAQAAREMLVGRSIVPEMVVAINEWLARIGVEEPFAKLAADAQNAAEIIQTGLQERLKSLSTEHAQQELKELKEQLEETGLTIERQLVRTTEASQAYQRAFAAQAAEIARVRGDDPTVMSMLARGQLPKGVGIRGEFKTMEIIDEGYQAISTEIEDRLRFSQEENEKLLALEQKHTTLRLRTLALERMLAEREVAALEQSMAAALDQDQDVEAFEKLNYRYMAAQEHLGDISEEIAFEREMITAKVAAEMEQELERAKSQARRTIRPAGAGVQVGGELIMPTITQVQVRNAQAYAQAMEEVAVALQKVPTQAYQEALLAIQKMLVEMKTMGPVITEQEQKRVVATARALAQAAEVERRRTQQYKAEEERQTQIQGHHLQVREMAIEKSADVVLQQAKRRTIVAKSEAEARTAVEKQEARAQASSVIEEERRTTAQLKEEERRRTLDHQDEIRKRQQAEREWRRARMEPTPADIARYGGGRLGAMSWAMQEAQMRQMGLRSLAYDISYMGRTATMMGAALTGPPVLAMRRFVEYTRETDRSARAMGLARDESLALRHELIEQSVALAMVRPEEMAEGLYKWVTGVGAAADSIEDLQKVIEATIPIQQMSYMQQIGLTQATEATAGILAEYRLEVDQTGRVVEVLTATADRTFAAVDDLGEAFKFVGPIAHDLGISLEETAAAMGLLADANIRGSMAGRALRQLMIRLLDPTEEEAEALNKALNRSTELGQSWKDLVFPEGKFIGLAKWIDLLAAATEEMTDHQRSALLATVSTANELPALTALVTRQIEARKEGINIIRAEAKVLDGVIDDEVEAYARWEKEVTGNLMSLEGAHEAFARKVKETTESEAYEFDQLRAKWDAAMLSLGESTLKLALPSLKELVDIVGDLSEYITANPWIAEALLAGGGLIATVGILSTTAATVLRAITIARTVSTAVQGWGAAQHILAADTQVVAANTQMAAANVQTRSTGALLATLGKLLLVFGGGFEIGRAVVGQVRGEPVGVRQTFEEIWDYIRKTTVLLVAPLGALAALGVEGADVWEGYVTAAAVTADLLGLTEDTSREIEGWEYELLDATEEMRNLKEAEREARQEARRLGDELMQLPAAARTGLEVFTEAELEAIDELEDYLQSRNELIERQNEALAEMEKEFLEKEADYYEDYLDKRAELERELRELSEERLWRASKDVQKAEKRIADAIEEYNKRVAEVTAEHEKRLRDLREDHYEKMEDLEANRDARGIISERRRYKRAVRDANEQKNDLLKTAKERLDETVKDEREKLEELRKERREDLEEKLRELDENYAKEAQKRKEAFDRQYADKQAQQAKELQQLERAHGERLAKIMGWEDRVRLALRLKYAVREQDLRDHLARMERAYLEAYNMIGQLSPEAMTPEEYRAWHEKIRGHQVGGYAWPGIYRLGEAGPEFVLSSPTTHAMERAIGHLTQAKVLGLAQDGGSSGGRFRLDIRVTADDHFSPAFAAQTEAIVRQEIVNLTTKVAGAWPGAYRPH